MDYIEKAIEEITTESVSSEIRKVLPSTHENFIKNSLKNLIKNSLKNLIQLIVQNKKIEEKIIGK